MRHDLSRDLGPEFDGEYLDRYVPSAPRETTLVFHSVGASDPLQTSDGRPSHEPKLYRRNFLDSHWLDQYA